MVKYKHTQVGYLLLVIYGITMAVISYVSIKAGSNPITLFALVIILLVAVLFSTLTVTIDEQKIRLQFGPGLIRKNFRLTDIEAHRVVKNPWYYGWGIRYTPRGWLFNVSGFQAVELHMKNGKQYRIGTDDPTGLAQALNDALKNR